MKKIFLPFLLAFCFFSCKKALENLVNNIDIPYDTDEILLPASLFAVNQSGELKGFQDNVFDRDSRIDNFQEARLSGLTVNILKPDSINFSIIKEINVYVLTDPANGNLPPKLISYKNNIAAGNAKSLALDNTGENIINYLQQKKYIIRTEIILRQIIKEDVTIKNHLVFNFKPKI